LPPPSRLNPTCRHVYLYCTLPFKVCILNPLSAPPSLTVRVSLPQEPHDLRESNFLPPPPIFPCLVRADTTAAFVPPPPFLTLIYRFPFFAPVVCLCDSFIPFPWKLVFPPHCSTVFGPLFFKQPLPPRPTLSCGLIHFFFIPNFPFYAPFQNTLAFSFPMKVPQLPLPASRRLRPFFLPELTMVTF